MKEVRINPLTRVEGLGRLYLTLRNGKPERVRLEIFEAPRFFEAILKGKTMDQVIDTVARVCGLCPVAYQMSAAVAFERILGLEIPQPIKDLRRVLYCGEWISSHSAHMFFMHLPDFLGRESFLEVSRERRDVLETALRIRRAGNRILEVIGGRHIHPVNVKVGGFYRLPSPRMMENLLKEIEETLPVAEAFLREVLSFPFPDFERDYEFVSLGGADSYPLMEGRIVSSAGWSVSQEEFEVRFEEFQEPHSTALYSRLRGGGFYLTGALARINNNFELLPEDLREVLKAHMPLKNPFKSLIVRAVEVVFALRESLRLLRRYEGGEASVGYSPRAGEGVGVTEAPRGILYHRYRVNGKGIVEFVNIVPPTAQNQGIMEEDVLEGLKRFGGGDVQGTAEKLVRNHDPCISCASHFLEVIRVP